MNPPLSYTCVEVCDNPNSLEFVDLNWVKRVIVSLYNDGKIGIDDCSKLCGSLLEGLEKK